MGCAQSSGESSIITANGGGGKSSGGTMSFGGKMDKCLPCTAAAQLVGCCNECKLSDVPVSSLCVKGNCKPVEDVPAE